MSRCLRPAGPAEKRKSRTEVIVSIPSCERGVTRLSCRTPFQELRRQDVERGDPASTARRLGGTVTKPSTPMCGTYGMANATGIRTTSTREAPCRLAPEEGPARPDHERDHELGEQRLDEPARTEELGRRVEQAQERREREEVERRAQDAELDMKRPMKRMSQRRGRSTSSGVHAVVRDADGRDVRKKLLSRIWPASSGRTAGRAKPPPC
jgi:hypothetical protein